MIREESNASLINAITNAAAVLPFISRHGGEIDWSDLLADGRCVFVTNGEDACIAFERIGETRDWECHFLFDKTCRGARAVAAGRAMRDHMMAERADRIFGAVPQSLPHALWFSRQMGGTQIPFIVSGGDRYEAQDGETLFAFEREA